jgi:hypothetical protein
MKELLWRIFLGLAGLFLSVYALMNASSKTPAEYDVLSAWAGIGLFGRAFAEKESE